MHEKAFVIHIHFLTPDAVHQSSGTFFCMPFQYYGGISCSQFQVYSSGISCEVYRSSTLERDHMVCVLLKLGRSTIEIVAIR